MEGLEHRERLRILDCVAAMQEADTLDAVSRALVETAMALVPCDHGGFAEVDRHFGRTRLFSSAPEVTDWALRKVEVWQHYFPVHPVLQFRQTHPEVSVVRLSDVTDLSDFYRSGLYSDLFREVETRHQIVLNLGFDPSDRAGPVAFPLSLGVPLNRSGSDFTDGEKAALAALRRLTRPVLRRKRALHQLHLMDRADLTPDLCRSLMGLGLTDRQAEVAFWMLKGKSNTDIATILGIGAPTVRHHSMAIFARLGVDGRLALQRRVILSMLDAG